MTGEQELGGRQAAAARRSDGRIFSAGAQCSVQSEALARQAACTSLHCRSQHAASCNAAFVLASFYSTAGACLGVHTHALFLDQQLTDARKAQQRLGAAQQTRQKYRQHAICARGQAAASATPATLARLAGRGGRHGGEARRGSRLNCVASQNARKQIGERKERQRSSAAHTPAQRMHFVTHTRRPGAVTPTRICRCEVHGQGGRLTGETCG